MNLYCERHSNLSPADTLFIHGNLASSRWWHPFLREWKKTGATGPGSFFFADWRGCGNNPDWHEPFTLKDLSYDFLELLERERLERVRLVAHSLGGLIAMQMMALAPKRFESAFLLDPVGVTGIVFDDSMYEAFNQMTQSRELTGTVILGTVFKDENLTEEFKKEITDDAFKAVKGIGSSILEILKTTDIREDAKNIKVPTLIVHGKEDVIIPVKDSEITAQTLAHAQLEVLSGVGHCWNVEDPAAFTRRVQRWMGGT